MSNFGLPLESNFNRSVRQAFLLPLAMMILLALVLSWLVSHLFDVASLLDHTDQVLAQAHNSERLVAELETGLRGFQVTGDKLVLEKYSQNESLVRAELNKLEELVSDNPAQRAQAKNIRPALEQWKTFARDMIDRRERNASYQDRAINAEGTALMDAVRREFAAFRKVEISLRESRTKEVERLKRLVLSSRWILALVYALVLGWFVRRQMMRVAASYQHALVSAVEKTDALEKSRNELRDQREWYQVTLSSIGDAVIATDPKGKVIFLNPVAEALTGWKLSDSVGQPLGAVFHIVNEQTHRPVESSVFKVLRDGSPLGLANHTAVISKAGVETAIEDSAAPIKDPAGNMVGVVMIFRDVTNRRQANEALRRSEERFRILFEVVPVAVYTCDRSYVIQEHNRCAVELWDREPNSGDPNEQFCGSFKLRRPDGMEMPHEQCPMAQVLRGEIPAAYNVDVLLERPDGSWRTVVVNSRPLKNERGEIVGAITCLHDITERKEAAAELERSKDELAAFLDTAPVLIWMSAPDKRRTYVNQGWLEFTGRAMAQEMGNGWTEGVHPVDLPGCLAAYGNAFDARQMFSMEYRLRRADGQYRWLLDRGTPRHKPDGTFVGYMGSCVDVTERRESEELRSNLAAIVQSSSDAILSKTLESTITSWNAAAERMFGYSPKEIIGQPILRLIPPELLQEEEQILTRLRAGQRIEHYETIRLTKAGHRLPVSLTISPIKDGGGRIVGASKIIHDVTERKQAEQALREIAERLHFMAESMPQKIFTAKPDGEVDYFNQQWMEFTGLSFDQIKGWAWTQFIHPDDVTKNLERWQESIDTGRTFQFEHRFRRDDGVYRWHLSRAHAMRDAKDKVIMWIGSDTDIDDQKQLMETLRHAKEQLAHYAVELEQEVAERTDELREANSQLEAFIYSVAHDLRHPLRALQGFSEILLESHGATLDESGQNYLQRINRSAQLMDKLLLDLLAYGRVARAPTELRAVPVQQVWDEAQLQCSQTILQTGARVETLCPLPLVLAHETTLSQILINLLNNALKFVSPGVLPRVKFFAEERDGFVRLCVEDNGIGIAPEHHERIFRVFERLGGSRYEGTGIGLSIVRKGAERMGGRAGVESASGQGSRFWVELPNTRNLSQASLAEPQSCSVQPS